MSRFSRQITNLQLAIPAALVSLFVCLAVVSNGAGLIATVLILTIVAACGGIVAICYRCAVTRRTAREDSIWKRPVSDRLSTSVINSVASVWLLVVVLIAYWVVRVTASLAALLITLLSLSAAIALGRPLKRRIAPDSLLAYAITFLGALLVILVAFLVLASARSAK